MKDVSFLMNEMLLQCRSNARPQMLKRSFSVREKLLNAILRVKLKYMKFFLSHEMKCLFAMQKTDIHVLELFCRAVMLELQGTESLVLELLRTLMLCLVQVSNCKATDAEKPLLRERKLLNAILRLKLKYMKDVSFS